MKDRGNTKKSRVGAPNNITNYITMTLTGFGAAPVPSLNIAIQRVLELLYAGVPLPEYPVTNRQVSLDERNRLICARYADGETLQAIAQDLGLSHQRVHQLIHRWC